MKEKVLLKDLINEENSKFTFKLFPYNDYNIEFKGSMGSLVNSKVFTKYENYTVKETYIEYKNNIDYLVIKLHREDGIIKQGYIYVVERSWMSDKYSTSMSDVLGERRTLKEAEKIFQVEKNSRYNDDKTIIQLNKYSLNEDEEIDELLENKKSHYGKLAKRWIFGE